MRKLVLALILLAWPAWAAEEAPLGTWETPHSRKAGSARVLIEACGNLICGRIVWLERPDDDEGRPKTDQRNRDPALRDRPILGLAILSGFQRDPEHGNRWVGGSIYNPEDGDTYKATITLGEDGARVVRGYVGMPLLGKSQVWRRPA